MNWYLKALKQYADFSGRARRQEYWMFLLFNIIFQGVAFAIDMIVGTNFVFIALYALAVFVPGLALVVRRLHDTGKSGWMYLVSFIPVIGGIWLLVLMLTDSEPGTNRWGTNPKEVTVA